MIRVTFRRDTHGDFSPREWDNLGTIAVWHTRYTLGDERPKQDPDAWVEELPEGSVVLPLYLYDHSGIALSVAPFSCQWDSGQIGFIVATPESIETMGTPLESVEECLRSEIATYNQYLSGDIFDYCIEESTECDSCNNVEWTHVDSCGGFYGCDDIEASGALAHIDEEHHALAREAFEKGF